MVTATAVVAMYRPMVLLPMRDSFLKSDSDATPATREVSTSGTAMSLSRFMKMSPNGNNPVRCEPGPLELRGGNAVDQSEDHPKDDLPVEFPVPFHA